ncbi:hypothetical protein BDZ94DRAFT_1249333, partial [Collybia nuda]
MSSLRNVGVSSVADLEAQRMSPHNITERPTLELHPKPSHISKLLKDNRSEIRLDSSPEESQNADDNGNLEQINFLEFKEKWKPWKPGEAYRTQVPESQTTMEDWVRAMEASDEGMCKGWREQIDTLIVFAGLFSAAVTAFSIESYQWLSETPANALARLQLRALLNATHDPMLEHWAPATFVVARSSIFINVLWFSSLTLALTTVVIGFLCKQWLYEYQRYENFTTKESLLVHGLRYRGLQAWRVPTIIGTLPILLQAALVLFLVGLLVLLAPLQPIVASIVTSIVGITFLFLVVTTVLPAIQYIYPRFHTQCAYKSSQSWSFFVFSAFWLFDFGAFTGWTVFDLWEVTCVYSGKGHTLSRVYKLLSNNFDAFLSIYGTLANISHTVAVNADLALVSDFVQGLDISQRDYILKAIPERLREVLRESGDPTSLERLGQLRGHISQHLNCRGKLKPVINRNVEGPIFKSSFEPFSKHLTRRWKAHHSQTQILLSRFLKSDVHFPNLAMRNRYTEHWAQCVNDGNDGFQEDVFSGRFGELFTLHHECFLSKPLGPFQWDYELEPQLVGLLSSQFQLDKITVDALPCF